ncbi:hypothetical protein DBR47_16475 [Paucibacter sp. KBW04]|uniref:hypothetical protein n=1 Tax=Paucibacter sp. KBW04 TaxID=2153361 RepID=UPI000F572BE0|nr:hypothetical protein [Paucibacter sp. KBW04]RQO56898.1 hypothetical protein DBR47_16475 [Paucibacter sp. KBW04]
MRIVLALAIAAMPFSVIAAEPSTQEIAKMQQKLMAETKVNARMGISVPISKFKSDGDPNTLEIVFLEKSEPGANTVADDGEVIFLFEASDELQSKLIGKAFEIRAKRRLGAV